MITSTRSVHNSHVDLHSDSDMRPTGGQRGAVRPRSAKQLPGNLDSNLELLNQFDEAIQQRVAAEQTLAESLSGTDVVEQELRFSIEEQQRQADAIRTTIDANYQAGRARTLAGFDREFQQAESVHRSHLRRIDREANQERREIERKREESEWVVSSVLDDHAEDSPLREFERFKNSLLKAREEHVAEWTDLESDCQEAMLQHRWRGHRQRPPRTTFPDLGAAHRQFQESVAAARELLNELLSLWLPKLFLGFRSLIVFAVLTLLSAVPIWMFADPGLVNVIGNRMQGTWIGVSATAGSIGGLMLTMVLYTLTAMRQSDMFRQIQQALAEAGWAHQQWLRLSKEELDRRQRSFETVQKAIEKKRQAALQRYQQAQADRLREITDVQTQRQDEEQERYASLHAELSARRHEQLELIDAEYRCDLAEAFAEEEAGINRLQQRLEEHLSNKQQLQTAQWERLQTEWKQASQQFEECVRAATERDRRQFPTWQELAEGWQPASTIPAQLRLGEIPIRLEDWENAIPADPRLTRDESPSRLPVLFPFPESLSVLFSSPASAGRIQGKQALQSLMLRLLTALPPGTVRFTMIDPLGLGESFGGFMHLADFDELLVNHRIWTESGQIEHRLADLTEHMENVFQKYLRNEFQTIEEYNASAGEVAEPYHFLVINDFPAKFSEVAARRLASIVNSGPRCGVYTLLNMDPARPMPSGVSLADLEPWMTCFDWQDGGFHYRPTGSTELSGPRVSSNQFADRLHEQGAGLSDVSDTGSRADSSAPSRFASRERQWPIEIELPPPPELFTTIVRRVGEISQGARRVEVAFQRIAPNPRDFWQGDSRSGLDIPLGRAGATKLQHLRLGKGTSQHMLVAGKTGSGKSTFLHILITNLALHYSPDEVNFYLIDFKKGVEFKDYAEFRLPHARVIAIESDREFGISTLQKLDDVLQERGELFRRHGVQDIAGFRKVQPRTPLPRILLIVDEFQEFFIEDDKLSQTASLLLDRLVRQGRAFGIHVVLGSQTLGGAYSLARSTLGQVAVRVALQCSESDAHLILSEENSAARLLTRPGEAIYNDANGLVEGNHPFQIAWLSDREREQALKQILERMLRHGLHAEPPVVFEGNIPSDLSCNVSITRLADDFSSREAPLTSPTIWLGDAVEIMPATAVTFHRQSGAHLLIVGSDAEAAQGMLVASMTALAASASPASQGLPQQQVLPSLFVFDGRGEEAGEQGSWRRLADALPVPIRRVSPRESKDVLNELTQELQRRIDRDASIDEQSPPIFLLVDHLTRFRDLRKSDDDFGMGGYGTTDARSIEPGKQFADLLVQGPAVGIHALIWCDSYNGLERWLSRQTLRELELRVALPMNPSDSSNFIDSPAASRMGTHRALLYREETGTVEKFRPYGLPQFDWIDELADRMKYGPESNVATDLEGFRIL